MSLTKLNIASLESPEFVQAPNLYGGRLGYHPDFETIENQEYEGRRLFVDNHQFRNCKFRSCNLVYSGGMYGFVDCEFDDRTFLSLTGSAARAVALFVEIAQNPEKGAFVHRGVLP